jgi:hypothetical protein
MPSLCKYKMCNNLASSSYQGYCNKDHEKRGLILEFQEQISTLTASLTLQEDLPLKSLKEEPVSVPHNTPNATPPASCNHASPSPTALMNTLK